MKLIYLISHFGFTSFFWPGIFKIFWPAVEREESIPQKNITNQEKLFSNIYFLFFFKFFRTFGNVVFQIVNFLSQYQFSNEFDGIKRSSGLIGHLWTSRSRALHYQLRLGPYGCSGRKNCQKRDQWIRHHGRKTPELPWHLVFRSIERQYWLNYREVSGGSTT